MKSVLNELGSGEIERIKARADARHYGPGEAIFAEGDAADAVYFVAAGRVSIYTEAFNTRQEIQTLGPGEFFGEMAVFNRNRRTASAAAVEASRLLTIRKDDFVAFLREDGRTADRIRALLQRIHEERLLQEKLIDATGLDSRRLHISIKGDPSLRESALFRERYESPVDKALPELVAVFRELLLERSAYRIFVGFNSGEIRISTVLDPFSEEFHPARRLIDETYLDRHFPRIDYERKAGIVRRVFASVRADDFFAELPEPLARAFGRHYEAWRPMPKEEVARAIAQFPALRSIPNYYVRNVTVGIIRDAIHMQFNCDGAHIVSAADYERFLQENL